MMSDAQRNFLVVVNDQSMETYQVRRRLWEAYHDLQSTLHGQSYKDRAIAFAPFCNLLGNPAVVLVFVLDQDGAIVATAQATNQFTNPDPKVIVNNVETLPHAQGQGYGRVVLNELEKAVIARWGPMKAELSNSPKKKNGRFYKRCGWTPRNDDRWLVVWLQRLLDWMGWEATDPTMVWIKQLG
jgi:GNAT superfamily N-acetyltransferase